MKYFAQRLQVREREQFSRHGNLVTVRTTRGFLEPLGGPLLQSVQNGCDAPLVNWHPSPFPEAISADTWSGPINWMLCQNSGCVELNLHFSVRLHCVYRDILILRQDCEVNSLAYVRGLCNIGSTKISAFIRVTLDKTIFLSPKFQFASISKFKYLTMLKYIQVSYAYWTVNHLDIWIMIDQLDDTCFIIVLTSETCWAIYNKASVI